MVTGDAVDVFRCTNADSGDDHDYVLVPLPPIVPARFALEGSAQPFVRHRELLWTYWLARSRGLTDGEWVGMAADLDASVAAVDGHGFLSTPFAASPALGVALGLAPDAVWVKDETGNVSGSHKARHLFGIALAMDLRCNHRRAFAGKNIGVKVDNPVSPPRPFALQAQLAGQG